MIRNAELLAERNAEILRLYHEGYNDPEIAQMIHLQTPSYVQKFRVSQGLKPNLTKRQKAVKELRLQGLCGREIADKLGIDVDGVSAVAAKVGLPFTEEEKKRSQELGRKKRRHTDESLSEMVQRHNPQFEYVGGYSGSEGTLMLRCKACGCETVRSIITVRHNGNVRCEKCARAETEARKIQKRQRQRELEQRKEDAFWNRNTVQGEMSVCTICGGVYLATRKNQKTCSAECAKRKANRKDRRVRRLTKQKIDNDITLEELFRRDHGICYLCGVECDWDDMEVRVNGTKVAGDWYPSIDHVRPIAKGGLHSWDNVRLAHRICNYLKSDAWTAPEKIS